MKAFHPGSIVFLLTVLLGLPQFSAAQKTIYVSSSEFHWTRGAMPPVIGPRVGELLKKNRFNVTADSNSADYTVRINSHSYYSGQTPYYYFGNLDATVLITDKIKNEVIFSKAFHKLKGGGTSLESADDKVYQNASFALADSIARFMTVFLTGSPFKAPAAKEYEELCDADKAIPVSLRSRNNTYLLIIVNEAYSPMQMARCEADSLDFHSRDAMVFRDYAERSLGIPPRNITFLRNSKSFEMRRELIKLASYSRGIQGNAELIFYYAGYGLIDEKTLEPYLLPVDVESDDRKFFISVSDLYKSLQEDPSKRVSIVLEAGFTFDALKPKPSSVKSAKVILRYPNTPPNFLLLAASKPGQKAWSDPGAGHGLLTLSIIKKLKATNGVVSVRSLSDYVLKEVRTSSVQLHFPEQIPVFQYGASLSKDLNQLLF
jgi:hypothetical protein